MEKESALILLNEMDRRLVAISEEMLVLKNKLEEPEEKFITVCDGFRGSLKLKECWTRDRNDAWVRRENIEIIAREEDCDYPFKTVPTTDHSYCYKEIKFRPFSPENPPPVDWPVESGNGIIHLFKKYVGRSPRFFIDGLSSLTRKGRQSDGDDRSATLLDVKFLNVEAVE